MDLKSQKYDRQLRYLKLISLWGSNGQALLESSSICLLGGTFTGCETLKNLILPGIGTFTIVDDQIVSEADAGSNFFLTMKDIGASRAEKCSQYLNELNVDVSGTFLMKSYKELILKNSDFFKQFSVIIATEFNEPDLILLGDICRQFNVPLVIVLSYGMIGYARVDFADHTIIESHEEGLLDLRLDNPWKELSDFANKFDFNNATTQFRSHIPFPIILLEAIKRWKVQGHSFPPQQTDRSQFVSLVKSITGVLDDDENSREAVAYCYKLYSSDKVPSNIRQLFNHESINQSKVFWVLVSALEKFVELKGVLPLPGKVPDMKADTISYISLQKIYREKAKDDRVLLKQIVDEILKARKMDTISDETIELFCKNCINLNVKKTGTIRDEFASPSSSIIEEIKSNPESDAIYYFLLRSADRFHRLHNRFPGSLDDCYSSDLVAFDALFKTFLKEHKVCVEAPKELEETVRAGGCQLPAIGAFMGGVASQEIIKIITHQYVPMTNSIIYNGISSTTMVFNS